MGWFLVTYLDFVEHPPSFLSGPQSHLHQAPYSPVPFWRILLSSSPLRGSSYCFNYSDGLCLQTSPNKVAALNFTQPVPDSARLSTDHHNARSPLRNATREHLGSHSAMCINQSPVTALLVQRKATLCMQYELNIGCACMYSVAQKQSKRKLCRSLITHAISNLQPHNYSLEFTGILHYQRSIYDVALQLITGLILVSTTTAAAKSVRK